MDEPIHLSIILRFFYNTACTLTLNHSKSMVSYGFFTKCYSVFTKNNRSTLTRFFQRQRRAHPPDQMPARVRKTCRIPAPSAAPESSALAVLTSKINHFLGPKLGPRCFPCGQAHFLVIWIKKPPRCQSEWWTMDGYGFVKNALPLATDVFVVVTSRHTNHR